MGLNQIINPKLKTKELKKMHSKGGGMQKATQFTLGPNRKKQMEKT